MSLQDGSVPLKDLLFKMGLIDSPLCRFCNVDEEWPSHILGKCPNLLPLAQNRHDRITRILFNELLIARGAKPGLNAFSSSDTILIYDQQIKCDTSVRYNKPDIMLHDIREG